MGWYHTRYEWFSPQSTSVQFPPGGRHQGDASVRADRLAHLETRSALSFQRSHTGRSRGSKGKWHHHCQDEAWAEIYMELYIYTHIIWSFFRSYEARKYSMLRRKIWEDGTSWGTQLDGGSLPKKDHPNWSMYPPVNIPEESARY